MNESKNNVPIMYQEVSAVAAMNRVPGFEPMKLLRRTKSRNTNEVVLKLDLPYKKLWFRLANPKGRIRLNALRVTEQLAIYEAQVFLDRNDTEPISCFTASCAREDATVEDYIRAAQEAATDEALSMAGFGIQFADVEMTKDKERYGSEIPLSAVPSLKDPVSMSSATGNGKGSEMAQKTMPQTVPVEQKPQVNVVRNAQPPVQEQLPVEAAKAEDTLPIPGSMDTQQAEAQTSPEPVEDEKQQLPVQEKVTETQKAMQILQGNVQAVKATPETVSPLAPEQTQQENQPKYTRDMPVEEILKLMTLEEAGNVVVDTGTCQGWTIAEVAERRAPVLKFYLFGGYKGNNNILLAAARIMYDQLEMKKAG